MNSSAPKDTFRGHTIVFVNGEWIYEDTRQPTVETWRDRGCGYCGLQDTEEGHDGCLGTLPPEIVMNACCGHGVGREAYVQYWDGSTIDGEDALAVIEELKRVV